MPRGGPSGGDGGHGGNVIMESTQRHNTLVYFRFNPEHKGERGEHGMGSNCTGRDGKDTILKVPVGTLLYDADTGELVHDFTRPDERVVIAARVAADAATSTSPLRRTRLRWSTNLDGLARNAIIVWSCVCSPMWAWWATRTWASQP